MTIKPRRRSITETHQRIAQLGWEPDYFTPAVKWPTRYTFPKKAKDPMKHIMREYLPMELEKDERISGANDAGVRAHVPDRASLRWLEILKGFIPVTNYAEVAAGRCMSMLIDTVPNNELRNGYHVQFVDEVRHTGLQLNLARWYAKHVPDPGGWNMGPKAMARSPITAAGINMLSHFHVGDPVTCAFALQIVAETAFTNIAFVALPDVAARNGDFVLPTTYLSVQSDEARHISNGYATLLTVLQDDANAPHIEQDLMQSWWINHAFIDVFSAGIMEYYTKDRSDPESYLDKWDRWVRDDWYRAYVLKLGKLGLNVSPEIFERARERLVKGIHHKSTMFGVAAWPIVFWRSEAMDERDFEWFEHKYPGWYDEYGMFWEAFRELDDPKDATLLLAGLMAEAPPSCWTCQLSCVLDDEMTHRVVDGRTRFYCSKECQWMDETNPGRYTGDRNWFDRYHGWDLADVVRELEFVQDDGKTLLGQPHLRDEGRWTLDDLARASVEVQSPNINTAKQMGLPSGDWHTPFVAAAENGHPQ
jgi:propane 2-monooxygenase large subunit